MVDSRAKGQRAEYAVRDTLRKHTGLQWERVPGSGGFNVSHGLKGDIYIPNVNIVHCIEIKHYKSDVINSNLMNKTESQLEKFWIQTQREADQLGKEPLLIFKKDRGKWIVAERHIDQDIFPSKCVVLKTKDIEIVCMLFDEWLSDKGKEYFVI
jgi:Holliday junction resolvase